MRAMKDLSVQRTFGNSLFDYFINIIYLFELRMGYLRGGSGATEKHNTRTRITE
jgi:hypothetical protein